MQTARNKILSLCAILVITVSSTFAQDILWKRYPYEIIAGFGPSFMLGELGGGPGIGKNSILDIDFLSTRYGGNIGFRKTFHSRVSWQATYSFGVISGNDDKTTEFFRNYRGLSFKAPLHELSYRIEYKIRREKSGHRYDLRGVKGERGIKLATYCYMGLGVYYFNPTAKLDGEWVELQPIGSEGQNYLVTRKKYSRVQVCVPMGLIAKYTINPRWAVSGELGLRFLFTDYLDDVSTTYPNPDLVAANDNTVTDRQAMLAADPDYDAHCDNSAGLWHFYNEQRGDPYDNDFYMFAQISAHYRLRPSNNSPSAKYYKRIKRRR